jgi:predicted RNA binding protein YcfA (HicA-like mRNA interferase family)
MKLPRDLSGHELVKTPCRNWGYQIDHQRGSHIVLESQSPPRMSLTVPAHNPLRIGTLNAILREVARQRGVPKEDVAASLG